MIGQDPKNYIRHIQRLGHNWWFYFFTISINSNLHTLPYDTKNGFILSVTVWHQGLLFKKHKFKLTWYTRNWLHICLSATAVRTCFFGLHPISPMHNTWRYMREGLHRTSSKPIFLIQCNYRGHSTCTMGMHAMNCLEALCQIPCMASHAMCARGLWTDSNLVEDCVLKVWKTTLAALYSKHTCSYPDLYGLALKILSVSDD